MDAKIRLIQTKAWIVSITVGLLAVVAWQEGQKWQWSGLTIYDWFPLFGLLAFSLMWAHYVAGYFRESSGLPPETLAHYFRITSYLVLICLLLHPGLLIYQLFQDGAGLPPGSYQSYVAPGLAWVVTLGFISLGVFLAFELHRVFKDRSWWHWVADASDVAMLAILYHGWQLGSTFQADWFKKMWWFYGVILIMLLVRKYYLRYTKKTPSL